MFSLQLLQRILTVLLLAVFPFSVYAEGNETLGPPSILIASGSGFVAGGVGLTLGQPGTLNITVPSPATIKQVLLYWEGQHYGGSGDNTIMIGATGITGTLIGGPNFFFNDGASVYSSTYRADITALGLVTAGANALSVGGLTFSKASHGAGIIVIYDDGTPAQDIQIVDGNDLAYRFFPAPRQTTVAQTFTFDPATTDRVAKLKMFFSSVEGIVSTGTQRPNRIAVAVGALTTNYDDELSSHDGQEWDTFEKDVLIPAGETSISVQSISGPGGFEHGIGGPRPASFAWLTAGVSIPPPTTTVCLRPPATSPCPAEGTFMNPEVLPNGDLLLYFEQSTGVNDNSYGTNVVGWGAKSHTFNNLVGSDKAQFVFYNGLGAKVLDIIVDYISVKAGTPSGYGTLGVSGGEGNVQFGSAAHVLEVKTSLDYNLNNLGLCVGGNCNAGGVNLLLNSPPTVNSTSYNVTNPAHSGWIFPITYTVRIAAAAFGPSGFGKVELPAIHNSPPKCGSNAIAYVPCGPSAPNPNVCADDKPGLLQFQYTGEDCNASNNPQSGKATCSTVAPLQPTVRILITDKSNPTDSKAKKWFDGTVNLGDLFEMKANNGGASSFASDSYYFIYSTTGQLLQSGKFHTSCSQPLMVGNQFGSLLLNAFQRQGYNPGSACEFNVKPGTLNLVYTGSNCNASNNPQGGKATCTDQMPLQGTVRVVMADKSNPADPKAKKWYDATVNIGDTVVAKASNGGKAEFSNDTYYFIYSTTGQLLQSGKIHTSCAQPLFVGNEFGAFKLAGFKPKGVLKMIEELEEMPEAFRLLQNYPNPFNPQTEIYFQLVEDAQVTLKIYNTLGQEVKTLVDGYTPGGIHRVTWDATDNSGRSVSSGIYFYQMRSGDFSAIKKMSLLK